MNETTRLPRAAAIHDISGFGKCSLTVALPILSACGVEAACMPTAVLSTHTGGIKGYTFRDLTEDMRAFWQHWKDLNIPFDAFYSGYLGSVEQTEIIGDMFDAFRQDTRLILVDPAMADNGRFYAMFDERMTTMTASRYLNETNTRGKKRKTVIDTLSAQIILQNCLDRLKYMK